MGLEVGGQALAHIVCPDGEPPVDAVDQHAGALHVAGLRRQEVGDSVQQGAAAVEDIVHHNHHGSRHELVVKWRAVAKLLEFHGVVQRGVFVHAQDAEQGLRCVDVAEFGGDALSQDAALAFDGGDHNAVGVVVVFQDLPGDTLWVQRAMRWASKMTASPVWLWVGGAHDGAISPFGSAACAPWRGRIPTTPLPQCGMCAGIGPPA